MKRVPIAPPTKFAKAMKSAQESGEKLIADGITLEGPTSKLKSEVVVEAWIRLMRLMWN